MEPQRRSKRYSRRFPVSLGGRLAAMTVDVSTHGFRIELPQVFLPGSKVDGFLLDGERELPFQGEVTWAKPGNPQLSLYSEMGIRFVDLSKELKQLLTQR